MSLVRNKVRGNYLSLQITACKLQICQNSTWIIFHRLTDTCIFMLFLLTQIQKTKQKNPKPIRFHMIEKTMIQMICCSSNQSVTLRALYGLLLSLCFNFLRVFIQIVTCLHLWVSVWGKKRERQRKKSTALTFYWCFHLRNVIRKTTQMFEVSMTETIQSQF